MIYFKEFITKIQHSKQELKLRESVNSNKYPEAFYEYCCHIFPEKNFSENKKIFIDLSIERSKNPDRDMTFKNRFLIASTFRSLDSLLTNLLDS